MTTIGELLSRDLSEPIEEVIKLDQQDEATVYHEITEYVATDRIKRQYLQVLAAMAAAPGEPTEGVGVWVSGFFGSGKSSFAKNLGYILGNRNLQGIPAAELFIQRLQAQSPNDPLVGQIANHLRYILARYDSNVIMFDVQVDRAVRKATEPIAEIMYTVLLRELDYAQDYDVAELEIELEGEGRLADFVTACARLFPDPSASATPAAVAVPATLPAVSPADYAIWQRIRRGAQRTGRTSAALHHIDPTTYPTPDSWATSLRRDTDITIRTLVERTFNLTALRKPDHAVVFIIDEVGQYVARSAEKIENLRAVVEHFGLESKNRVQAGQAVAPVWVIVTSQEKLDEVVAAIDDKRVDLAKLQDRFRTHIDMAPADIREVATKRVLSKHSQGERLLAGLYDRSSALLSTHTRLERTELAREVSQADFVQFYPYLPYFIDLSIDIVSGIRLQAGAPRHIGGSNRTIIKQAYEMLVSDRTRLMDEPVGALVTIDRIYDLVEGNLPSEKQRDISEISRRYATDPWPTRTAKAIVLLEYVRTVPRTETNLAALLYRNLGDESALPQVQQAVELLEKAQYIRHTEQGWKLQTTQEKSWTAERNSFNPTPRERNDILEEQLRAIFQEPGLSRFRYQNYRTFRVAVTWNNRNITSGDAEIPVILYAADDPDAFADLCTHAQQESRAPANQNAIAWAFYLNTEIDDLITELYRSKRMVGKYDQLRAQGKLTGEEPTSLANERSDSLRLENRLRERLASILALGKGFFRGVSKDGSTLGHSLGEIFRELFAFAVPDLYSKLTLGARPIKAGEPLEILRAANLNGLPKIYYSPPDGLDLVSKEGMKYVVNSNAPIVKEVAGYLMREHSYGNKVTGRTLESHFGGIGYGWEAEILWLVLATLLRAGAIEVTYQGRRYRSHLDPNVRASFSGANAFRSTSFAPRKAPDLQALVAAARRFEELTGEEVDVEESAIAQAFQTLARTELQQLLPLEATVQAHNIPKVGEVLTEFHNTLEVILNSASDDCVNMLAGEGASFQTTREQVHALRRATDANGLAYLTRLNTAVRQLWPQLDAEGLNGDLRQPVVTLRNALEEGTFYLYSSERETALHTIEQTYHELYSARHRERAERYQKAIDDITAQPDWIQIQPELQATLLKPLTDRACQTEAAPSDLRCPTCAASLSQMASDLVAVDGLRNQVLAQLQQLLTPQEKIERVRIVDVVGFNKSLETNEEVDELLDNLRSHLYKLISAGTRIILE